MNRKELIEKIIEKKEFSGLPEKDVEYALKKFEKRQTTDEERIKLTRDLLRSAFSSFTSKKLLSPKNKDEMWILRKHLSTRERLGKFKEIYSRIFLGLPKKISVIDLGAGINGFSYKYFLSAGYSVNYTAIEAINQLNDLMNIYFKNKEISGKAIHKSIFELSEIKKIISQTKRPRVVFLFKVIDSLEILEKDYSKKLLKEIVPSCDRVVVSFATESMHLREKFHAQRKWLTNFIEKNFEIIDDFYSVGERFIIFKKSKTL